MPFEMNATKKISVLCATRGRPAMVMESIKSMIDTADDPDGIEFLLEVNLQCNGLMTTMDIHMLSFQFFHAIGS